MAKELEGSKESAKKVKGVVGAKKCAAWVVIVSNFGVQVNWMGCDLADRGPQVEFVLGVRRFASWLTM